MSRDRRNSRDARDGYDSSEKKKGGFLRGMPKLFAGSSSTNSNSGALFGSGERKAGLESPTAVSPRHTPHRTTTKNPSPFGSPRRSSPRRLFSKKVLVFKYKHYAPPKDKNLDVFNLENCDIPNESEITRLEMGLFSKLNYMNKVVACTKELLERIYPLVIRYVDQARILSDTRYDVASILMHANDQIITKDDKHAPIRGTSLPLLKPNNNQFKPKKPKENRYRDDSWKTTSNISPYFTQLGALLKEIDDVYREDCLSYDKLLLQPIEAALRRIVEFESLQLHSKKHESIYIDALANLAGVKYRANQPTKNAEQLKRFLAAQEDFQWSLFEVVVKFEELVHLNTLELIPLSMEFVRGQLRSLPHQLPPSLRASMSSVAKEMRAADESVAKHDDDPLPLESAKSALSLRESPRVKKEKSRSSRRDSGTRSHKEKGSDDVVDDDVARLIAQQPPPLPAVHIDPLASVKEPPRRRSTSDSNVSSRSDATASHDDPDVVICAPTEARIVLAEQKETPVVESSSPTALRRFRRHKRRSTELKLSDGASSSSSSKGKAPPLPHRSSSDTRRSPARKSSLLLDDTEPDRDDDSSQDEEEEDVSLSATLTALHQRYMRHLQSTAGHARSVAELRRRMLNLQQRAVGDQTWARAGPGITTMVWEGYAFVRLRDALGGGIGNKPGQLAISFKHTATQTSDWRRKWLSCDQQDGSLTLTDAYSAATPTVVNLLLVSIRPEADQCGRPYCLELIDASANITYQIQCPDPFQRRAWVRALTRAVELTMSRHQPSTTRVKRSMSCETMDTQSREVLQHARAGIDQIRKIYEKRPDEKCCECNAEHPDWGTINLGQLFCIACAGAHRRLGVRYSVVRSLTLDQLDKETMQFLLNTSNKQVNDYYEASLNNKNETNENNDDDDEDNLDLLPGMDKNGLMQTATQDQRLAFVRAKYIDKRWVSETQPRPPMFDRYSAQIDENDDDGDDENDDDAEQEFDELKNEPNKPNSKNSSPRRVKERRRTKHKHGRKSKKGSM